MPIDLGWRFGAAEKRRNDKRRDSSRTRPPLRGEPLERRDLLTVLGWMSGASLVVARGGEVMSAQNLFGACAPSAVTASALALSQPAGSPSVSAPAVQNSAASSASAAPQQQQLEPDVSVSGGPFTYDGFPHPAIGTAVAAESETPISGDFSYTYNGSPTAPTNAGTYSVVATFTSSDPNYSNGTATATLTINPAVPTITVTGGTFTFDFKPHPATATAVGVDGVTPVGGSFSFTYNGSSTPPTNGGSYAVVATFASSDPNYAAGTATTTITIPDPTIPTGVTVSGASTTSVTVAWNPVTEPTGGTPTYSIYEKITHPGHGGGRGGIVPTTYSYNLVASGLTTTSTSITGLQAAPTGGTAKGHAYVVVSVLNGVSSAHSIVAAGAPLYAPFLGYFLVNGAIWSGATPLNVTVGQTTQVSLQGYGNQAPTFSVLSAPNSVSIDPTSGMISITPAPADVGTFTATFQATNSLGSTSASLLVHVLPLPTVVVTGGNFVFDGATHGATAVALASDGVTPIAGTFMFQYSPVVYPSALSTAPYAEVGSYIVHATFTSSDPNYGNTTATGIIVIGAAQNSPITTVTVGTNATFALTGNSADGGTMTIVNNSVAAPGVLVDGTNQVTGGIDGTGNTVVNPGGNLTAGHINQGSLAIGGTASNPGMVTIAPSDASGNPLASMAAAVGSSQAAVGAAAVPSGSGSTAASEGRAAAAPSALKAADPVAATVSSKLLFVPQSATAGLQAASPLPAADSETTFASAQAPILAAPASSSIAPANDLHNIVVSDDVRAAAIDAIFADDGIAAAIGDDALLDLIGTSVRQSTGDRRAK